MTLKNYIGVNGLVTQDMPEIKSDIEEQLKTTYGVTANIEQNSPDGQFINILAQEKKDILDLFTQYYNNLDVDRVIGIPQQILYKLNGLTINAYTYSYCYVQVTNTKTVNLQGLDANIDNADGTGYTVADTNGNRWILAESTSLTTIGSHTLNFRAANLGAITSLPNTITVMETIVVGISGVNNAAVNYITGNKGETSAEFRLRRNKSMAIPSQGFDDSIQSQLLNLDNVKQVRVYNNRTSSTVSTIPPHTIWVIVQGGLASEIGSVIRNNLPPGIPMKGAQSVQIARPYGDYETINYDIPTAVPLYIMATIKNLTSSPLDANYIKQELAKETFDIGEMAENANITTALKNIVGNTGAPYDVELSKDGTNYVEYVSPTNLDEYFSISASNINLTVV